MTTDVTETVTVTPTPPPAPNPITATFPAQFPPPPCESPGYELYQATDNLSLDPGVPSFVLDLDIADVPGTWEVKLNGPSNGLVSWPHR